MRLTNASSLHVSSWVLVVASAAALSAPLAHAETVPDPIGSLVLDGVPSYVTPQYSSCYATTIRLKVKNNGSAELHLVKYALISKKGSFSLPTQPHAFLNLGAGDDHLVDLSWVPSGGVDSATARVGVTYEYSVAAIDAERKRIRLTNGAEVAKLERELDQAKKLGPDTTEIDVREAKARKAWKKRKAELDDDVDVAERTIDELKKGLFCSQCKRSKSQIEKQDHVTFEQHLGQVQGTPVPATKEAIEAAEKALEVAKDRRKKETVDFVKSLDKFEDERKAAADAHEKHLKQLGENLDDARARLKKANDRLSELDDRQLTTSIDVSVSCGKKQ